MSEQPSSKDDVRRGLGMLPQQALFAKAPKGDFVKMSEPVQVYTACQFVKGQNLALIYFQLGNNSAMPPVSNSSTSRNALFPYLNLCPTWVQLKLRVLTIEPVSKSGTSQRAGTVPLANLARSYFYSRRVVGKLYGNFRPTASYVFFYAFSNLRKLLSILSLGPKKYCIVAEKMTSSQIETKSFHIIFILCYPVITGHCLIHNMVKYKRTLSQENFSVIAFRQELI